jgi:hypothetical protein
MQIHVARAGKELGTFSQEEVRARLASGEFQPTDHGWAEGLADWTLLSAFPGLASTKPASSPLEPAAGVPPSPDPEPSIPSQPRAAVAATAASPATLTGSVRISSEAVSSLILGILSISLLPVVTAIPAIIFGHIARSRIQKARGTLGGSGLAQAGLITGYIGAGLSLIALLAAVALSIAGFVHAKSARVESISNGQAIVMACRLYAADHQGNFPKTLEALVPDYLPNRAIFVCPFSGPSEPIGYEYYGGKDSDAGRKVLLVSKGVSAGKRRVVVYVDGSAELVKNMRELPLREPAPR